MPPRPRVLTDDALAFLTDYHLATLSTPARDGGIHSVAVGFTWDAADGLVRIITSGPSQKVLNVRRGGHASVCQVDGARWISFAGPAAVSDDPDDVADAVARYTARYRPPRVNPLRVVITLRAERILGSAGLLG